MKKINELKKVIRKSLRATKKIIKDINKIRVAAITTGITVLASVPAFAAPSPGTSLASWFKEQALAVAGVVMSGVIIRFISKKNIIGIILTVFIGGIVMVFITNPEFAQTIANWFLELTNMKG